MIKPTVGRKLWYTPGGQDGGDDPIAFEPCRMVAVGEQPLDATVVCVLSDRLVNLVVLDANGNMFKRPATVLLQDNDAAPTDAAYARWMPYQIASA